jgi:hypothetical protein
MVYIGFHVDKETLEKLKIIGFIKNKNRSELIREGIELVIKNNSGCFEKFQKHVDELRK